MLHFTALICRCKDIYFKKNNIIGELTMKCCIFKHMPQYAALHLQVSVFKRLYYILKARCGNNFRKHEYLFLTTKHTKNTKKHEIINGFQNPDVTKQKLKTSFVYFACFVYFVVNVFLLHSKGS